jgi:hypothetical protein
MPPTAPVVKQRCSQHLARHPTARRHHPPDQPSPVSRAREPGKRDARPGAGESGADGPGARAGETGVDGRGAEAGISLGTTQAAPGDPAVPKPARASRRGPRAGTEPTLSTGQPVTGPVGGRAVLKAAKASRAEPSLSTAQPAPRPLGDPPAKVGQGFEARTGGRNRLEHLSAKDRAPRRPRRAQSRQGLVGRADLEHRSAKDRARRRLSRAQSRQGLVGRAGLEHPSSQHPGLSATEPCSRSSGVRGSGRL